MARATMTRLGRYRLLHADWREPWALLQDGAGIVDGPCAASDTAGGVDRVEKCALSGCEAAEVFGFNGGEDCDGAADHGGCDGELLPADHVAGTWQCSSTFGAKTVGNGSAVAIGENTDVVAEQAGGTA